MRFLSAFCAALAFPAFAFAACQGPQGLPEPGPELPASEGQFHFQAGRGLGCMLAHDQGEAMRKHERGVSFLSCLRIGPIGVGDSLAQVEAVLGPAAASTDLDMSSESRLYEVAQKGVLRPHYVVTYREDHVVAVQLIGPPMRLPAYFSGLTLGDDVQKVVDRLGPPAQRCRTRSEGPEMWIWRSFPIALDVIEGYVAGFKVTWPAGK